MAMTLLEWRPSALPAARPSLVDAHYAAPCVRVLGAATAGAAGRDGGALALPVPMAAQLNTLIGASATIPAPGMAVEGTGKPAFVGLASAVRTATIDAGNVQRDNGIQPRGRCKV